MELISRLRRNKSWCDAEPEQPSLSAKFGMPGMDRAQGRTEVFLDRADVCADGEYAAINPREMTSTPL
jgi:hypothetical protein